MSRVKDDSADFDLKNIAKRRTFKWAWILLKIRLRKQAFDYPQKGSEKRFKVNEKCKISHWKKMCPSYQDNSLLNFHAGFDSLEDIRLEW